MATSKNLRRASWKRSVGAGRGGGRSTFILRRMASCGSPGLSQWNDSPNLSGEQRARGPWAVPWEKIWAFSEDLAKFVSDVSGLPLRSGALLVNAARGCFIPENRDFIEEAVRSKSSDRKYSSRDSSRLILVIGAASTILPAHIEIYRRDSIPSEVPFSDVWIVPAFSGHAIPLKRSLRPTTSSASA
jgi:hypothetical protein